MDEIEFVGEVPCFFEIVDLKAAIGGDTEALASDIKLLSFDSQCRLNW